MAQRLKKIVFVVGIIYSCVYVVGCLTPYIHPSRFVLLSYLALAFPYLLIGMIGWLLATVIFYRKYSFIFFIMLLCGFKNIYSSVAFNKQKAFVQTKPTNGFRLLSWNVDEFINSTKINDRPNSPRRQILAFVQKIDADVLCLQDFSSSEDKKWLSNFKYIKDTLHYPYYRFSVDDKRFFKKDYQGYGTVIFSRFPITDSARFPYDSSLTQEHLQYVDINIGKNPIRFFTTHLCSMTLKDQNKNIAAEPIILKKDSILTSSNKRIVHKLRYFDLVHAQQAIFVKQQINQSKYPFVFCADINATPSSYTYQYLAKGLKDAFLENGLGFGGTFDGIAPIIRIDVVLHSPQLVTTQYYSPHLHLSDHFPIVTDIQVP